MAIYMIGVWLRNRPEAFEHGAGELRRACASARQILPGGYISYIDLETNEWQQLHWEDPNRPPTLNVLSTQDATCFQANPLPQPNNRTGVQAPCFNL